MNISIRIVINESGSPSGKLADAEVLFHDAPLAGCRLIGFAIWERRNGPGRNVTFPARSYSVNGERRSFSLLRAQDGQELSALGDIRDRILDEYAKVEALIAEASAPTTPTANGFTFAGHINR